MKRKLDDKHVAIIKQMLSTNYKSISIMDFMQKRHGISITSAQIYSIKRLEAYFDIKPDLNDAIRKTYSMRANHDEEVIGEIKFALAYGYSNEEIIRVYKISKSKLLQIRMCHLPYSNIAPEYNYKIQKLYPRKHTNIDNKMVKAIKKEYVDKNGNVLLSEIAKKHKIDKGTVSTIISLKYYKNVGVSFNSKINNLKRKKVKLRNVKKMDKINAVIEKEMLKNKTLSQKKKQLENELKKSNDNLKNLRKLA